MILSLFAALVVGSPQVSAGPPTLGTGPRGVEGPFQADTILRPPGGPLIVMLPAQSADVAALRLFVPLVEGPVERGAGQLIEALARERIEGLARPVGARVLSARTPRGLAYSLEGATADFEYLAYLLRQAVAIPDIAAGRFEEVRRTLVRQASGTWETPAGRVDADLRLRLPGEGTTSPVSPTDMEALDAARVLEVWRRSHQQSAMTLVVSAAVLPEVVLADVRGLGSSEENSRPPLAAPTPGAPNPPPVQTLRRWYGLAYDAGEVTSPAGPVVARLVARHLRFADGGFEASVRLWERSSRWVLVVRGAAYRKGARAMKRTLDAIVAETRNGLRATSVADARARVREAFLLGARTPLGMVTTVGRTFEATGDLQAASRYRTSLDTLTDDDVRALLARMVAATPVRVEVAP